MKEKPEDLVLFLGAGASMPFGIPGMSEFVKLLDYAVQEDDGEISVDDDEKELWQKLLTTARQEYEEVDLEWILSVLNGLSQSSLWPIIRLADVPFDENNLERRESEARRLKRKIEEYIKEKCQLPSDKKNDAITFYSRFFEELLHARGYHPKIFTTNYDNVIESSNEERNHNIPPERPKIALVNGFSPSIGSRHWVWNPEVFEAKFVDNSLPQYFFKLHGSITWYATQSNILEIPVIAQSMKLTSGEEAASLLIYPVEEKRIFSPPFTELFYQFRSTLLYKARILVVIGYSFRDEIFQYLFKEALERNKALRIFVANTDTKRIKEVQDEFGENRIVPIMEEFGTGDFIPSLLDKLWAESSKKIIYQAEHLPKSGPARIVEDPEAENGLAVELTPNPGFIQLSGAIYGPYRPLPEPGDYEVFYRMKIVRESSQSNEEETEVYVDISPAPGVRENYGDKQYPSQTIVLPNPEHRPIEYQLIGPTTPANRLKYSNEPSMEYRIQSTKGYPIRVDYILVEKVT